MLPAFFAAGRPPRQRPGRMKAPTRHSCRESTRIQNRRRERVRGTVGQEGRLGRDWPTQGRGTLSRLCENRAWRNARPRRGRGRPLPWISRRPYPRWTYRRVGRHQRFRHRPTTGRKRRQCPHHRWQRRRHRTHRRWSVQRAAGPWHRVLAYFRHQWHRAMNFERHLLAKPRGHRSMAHPRVAWPGRRLGHSPLAGQNWRP